MQKILLNQLPIFHQKIQHGCVFVCSACHQTNFEDNVLLLQNLQPAVHSDLLKACLTGYLSVNNMEFVELPKGQSIKGLYQNYQ